MADAAGATRALAGERGGMSLAASHVSAFFGELVSRLAEWRDAVLEVAPVTPGAVDDRVRDLVLPWLSADDALLVGAGFIAAPAFAGTPDVHFAWWLGPLDENPVSGATTQPTRLDLGARDHADYLRDFRALEWYRIPETTHRTHITGPYVDHLCACDYIVTVTEPVERDGGMIGVVGVDVYVRRLEREVLPALLAVPEPVALVNGSGRILVSTDPERAPGTLVPVPDEPHAVRCAGTPFSLVLTPRIR